ncbi:unnamed protein product [Rhizophagus irregularis]|nr:unnamed protein product [Rhizophagus irregularis]CAB5364386.1 unnamed protein product [Rhizophagus irregularis]
MRNFVRSFAGLEIEYLRDFYEAQAKNKNLAPEPFERAYLNDAIKLYLPGEFLKTFFTERCNKIRNNNILHASVFTIKLGAEYLGQLLYKILRENNSERAKGAVKKEPMKNLEDKEKEIEQLKIDKKNLEDIIDSLNAESAAVTHTSEPITISQVCVNPNAQLMKDGKRLTAKEWNKEKAEIIDKMNKCVTRHKEEANEAQFLLQESMGVRDKAEARIKSLENDLKIERERIKSLENDIKNLEKRRI